MREWLRPRAEGLRRLRGLFGLVSCAVLSGATPLEWLRQRAALVAGLLDVLPIEPFDAQVSATCGRLGISLALMGLLIAAYAVVLHSGLECVSVG